MKAFFEKLGKKKTITGGIVVVIILVMIFSSGGGEEVLYETVIAERKDLVQEISATGRVEAVDRINLAFEKSGRVETVHFDVGDMVGVGQALVALESSELYAELAQALASVESAEAVLQQHEAALLNQQAKLAELNAGTRGEEILFYEAKVQNANIALEAAHESMINAMNDAYTRSEDAVRSKADQLFNNPKSANPDLKFTITNSGLRTDLNSSKAALESILTTWKLELDTLSASSDLDEVINTSKSNLDLAKLFLEKMSSALTNALTTATITQTTIDAWKVEISAARTSINLAVTNHSTAKEKLNTAETALVIAQNELTLKESGSTPEQIDAQVALIRQAEANVSSQLAQIKLKESAVQAVQARLSKNTLRSPIAGIVTKQNAKEGAIVGVGELIASVISDGVFEIEALIVEADIVGLEVGDRAALTLDAYGDDVVFRATVTDIEPAADLVEGVANYRTTLMFEEDDERVRAGMTADLDIVTAEREGAISIPQRAVIFKSGEKIVRILEGDVLREVDVETGIRGERGLIEIVTGINEGDVVVTVVNE